MAHDATGFGLFSTSTRLEKQKEGTQFNHSISVPAGKRPTEPNQQRRQRWAAA